MFDRTSHPALQLWDAGYRDLIAIAPPNAAISKYSDLEASQLGKTPAKLGSDGWYGFAQWPDHETTRADVERWVAWGAGFGLRTRNFPTIDVDIDDAAIVEPVRLALERLFGQRTVCRIGRAPRFALPCRTDAPFKKVQFALYTADGDSVGTIEILANGNQFVVDGTHPKTGKPYNWTDGEVSGGAELLAATPATSLPMLTAEAVLGDLESAVREAAAECQLTVTRRGDPRRANTAAPDQPSLRAPSVERLREALSFVPNDEGYDSYIKMAYAIKAATGPNDDAEGLDMFLEWSSRWSAGVGDRELDCRTWAGIKGPCRVGYPWIAETAREFGFDDASDEFTILSLSPEDQSLMGPANVDEEAADFRATTMSEHERVAALLGDADRAFLSALPDVASDHFAFWEKLVEAASAADPLRDVFRGVILKQGKALRMFADEPNRFAVFFDAEFATEPRHRRLSTMTEDEMRVLRRAAYTALAPRNALSGQAVRMPRLVTPSSAPREELVRGLIPATGIAAFVAAPAAGKTFASIELAARIASEPPLEPLTLEPQPQCFGGYPVQHGSVLMFLSEDVAGVDARLARWAAAYGELKHLHIFDGVPSLSSVSGAITSVHAAISNTLSAEAPPLRLIVIDLFRDALVGDENSSEVVGAAMDTARTIARLFQTAVLLVHHAGHGAPERARGSSAFMGALDFAGSIKKEDDLITLTVQKNKNAPAGAPLRWCLVDGVLRDVASRTVAVPNSGVTEACAVAAAYAIRDIATEGAAVTRTQLASAMREARADLFPSDGNRTTRENRISRGIKHAEEQRWIVRRQDRYVIGPERPDVLVPAGDLSGLIS